MLFRSREEDRSRKWRIPKCQSHCYALHILKWMKAKLTINWMLLLPGPDLFLLNSVWMNGLYMNIPVKVWIYFTLLDLKKWWRTGINNKMNLKTVSQSRREEKEEEKMLLTEEESKHTLKWNYYMSVSEANSKNQLLTHKNKYSYLFRNSWSLHHLGSSRKVSQQRNFRFKFLGSRLFPGLTFTRWKV